MNGDNYKPNGDELRKMKREEIKNLKDWVASVDHKVGNHITETRKEVGKINTTIAGMGTDVAWIKRFFWVVVTGSVTTVFGIIVIIIQNV